MKQKSGNNRKNSTEKYYSPTAVVIAMDSESMLCQSGNNENFTDNTTPVDWFTTNGN